MSEFCGCAIDYEGQRLRCYAHRTYEENETAAKQALALLLGVAVEWLFTSGAFEDGGGVMQRYKETG